MGKYKILDFKPFSGGFHVDLDIDKSEPICVIVLSFPNSTQVTIKGDGEVVKQLVDRLDGVVIEYEAKK